jgi:uncharacterized membrane protein
LKKLFILKAFSWRLVGTLDLLIISYIITGNPIYGISISLIDSLSKIFLYYCHEKIWTLSKMEISDLRHLIKSFSWRVLATVFTFILTYILISNVNTSFKITSYEFFTKIFLYFIHEKIWHSNCYLKNVRE